MYYAKYLKYKYKYIQLKYQLGGGFNKKLIIKNKNFIQIPTIKTFESIKKIIDLLENNLVGFKLLETKENIKNLLIPLVLYNKRFRSNPIYFYRYKDNSNPNNSIYIYASLNKYSEISNKIQKKNILFRKVSIDESGNITLILNINMVNISTNLVLETVKENLIKNLIGIKVLQSNLLLPLIKDNEFNNKYKIYYYKCTDGKQSYIICSLYDYYEFLYILYQHIEIEEVIIDINGKIIYYESDRINHIIHKPERVYAMDVILSNMKIFDLDVLSQSLKLNLFIIISNNQKLLTAICMYNLFIGTIHIFTIFKDKNLTNFFLLSLFTQDELNKKGICISENIEIYECRLYKQGDKIEFILYKNLQNVMFNIYNILRDENHYGNKLNRSNTLFNNKFLNEIDTKLLEKCSECISVKDIAFNTTLFLLPDKIEVKDHKDILKMEKDFLKNSFELINSNEKLYLWKYKYEDLIQLWEYSLEDLEKEVDKFKNELLELEPNNRDLLVLELNKKGFKGHTMEQILENSTLCYLKDEDKDKRLLYENTVQIDPVNNEFVRNCNFIPEIKKLLETNPNPESELHKYRQTVILSMQKEEGKKYQKNQLFFFAMSWYDPTIDVNINKSFELLFWSLKLNKLTFQCLAIKDRLIFPIRIINSEYLESPLSYVLNIKKQDFCGYFHTRFTDNYNCIEKFDEKCRDKFYFIYSNNEIVFITGSGKKYELFYYTGNSIWFDVSILPYYKIILCEINWIYYSFILKYKTIPHFYKYINENNELEIVVSKYALNQIYNIYREKGYDELELKKIEGEVFYNHNYYKIINTTDKIFVEKPLLNPEKQKEFIHNILRKIKI